MESIPQPLRTREQPTTSPAPSQLANMLEFLSRVRKLRNSIKLVIRGINQLCSSSALRGTFRYILEEVNHVHLGRDDASILNARRLPLHSLATLSQTKARTEEKTFLQCVVQCIERDAPELLWFPQEITLIHTCCKVSFSSQLSEKRELEEGFTTLKNEATAVVAAGASSQKIFATEVELELQALQSLFDELTDSKQRFLKYFEEEDSGEELDELLTHIANFTAEVQREHTQRTYSRLLVKPITSSAHKKNKFATCIYRHKRSKKKNFMIVPRRIPNV